MPRLRKLTMLALLALWAPTLAAAGAPDMVMHLDPPDGKPLAAETPVTFGVVFRPGQIPAGKTAAARLDGKAVPAQVDAKRHFADGSLKHAIVSMVLPALGAGGAALTFAPADPPAAGNPDAAGAGKLLAGDFDADVRFKVPEGKIVSASARRMLEAAGNKAPLWLNGPVAVEWLLAGPPADDQGNADPDLNVEFQVRSYPATGSVRVSAVVELCGNGGSDGGLIYDVAFTRGKAKPEVVFEQKGVHQPDLTRYRKVFWVGGEPPAVVVRHDAHAMAAAGVIPQYDFGLDVSPAVADVLKRGQAAKTGLFENGLITPYMPMTGGRWDLGVLPLWSVVYLYTMDPRVKQIVLETDDLSGGIPIHARLRETGRVPTYKGHEMLWLHDDRAGRWGTKKWRPKPDPPRTPEPVKSTFSPDVAHLPSLCYVPYVVTGDYYELEENWFWAAYITFCTNPGYSKGALTGQLRGMAWGLRTWAITAAISPDGTPEQAEFGERTQAALGRFLEWLDAGKMPLGMLAPHGGGGKINYAPWQHDYMIMAVDAAANAGFKQAETHRSRLLDFSMGRFTHAPDFDPMCGCGYWWDVGTDKGGITVKTWKDLFELNYAVNKQKRNWADYAGGYCDLALAAASIGLRTGHPQARQVYDFLKANTHNVLSGRARCPVFAYSKAPIH